MKVDDAWKLLQQVNEWIRFADAKAAAILAASGILGGLDVKAIPSHRDLGIHPIRAVLLGVAMVCLGGSSLITLRTLAPRLRAGEARSLLYFEHIARKYRRDRRGYVENLIGLADSDSELSRQVAEQVWSNSLVARRKFRRVMLATWLLAIAMLSSGLAVVAQRLWNW